MANSSLIHRRLFISATLLTIVIATLTIVFSPTFADAKKNNDKKTCANPDYRRKHPNKCRNFTPEPTTGGGPSTPPTASSTTNPTPRTTPIAGDYENVGELVVVSQNKWAKTGRGSAAGEPVIIDGLTPAKSSLSVFDKIIDRKTAAKRVFWQYYRTGQGLIFGVNNGLVKTDKKATSQPYFISDAFTTQAGDSTLWQIFHFSYKPLSDAVHLYYRVDDEGSTSDPNDSNWIPVEYGGTDAAGKKQPKKTGTVKLNINQIGKYFQYMFKFETTQASGNGRSKKIQSSVDSLGLTAQPLNKRDDGPAPDVTPSPTTEPSPSEDPAEQTGTMKIYTKKFVVNAEPTDEPLTEASDGPSLPDTTTVSTPTPPTKIDTSCSGTSPTEPADNIAFTLKQKAGDRFEWPDESTDDDGYWDVTEDGTDAFATGTYEIKFGPIDDSDYKLVAICVAPDDGLHHLKTLTNPLTGIATIIIRGNQETRVTAFYGPKDKPHIVMNKYAVANEVGPEKSRKVLRVLYPGQKFSYLINWKNTGDQAKNVRVLDVLPDQVVLDEAALEAANDETIQPSRDNRGRLMVTKTFTGAIAAGAQGSFLIPVQVKDKAFEPDTIVP